MDSTLTIGLRSSIFHLNTTTCKPYLKPPPPPPLSFPSYLHFPRNPSSNPQFRLRASSNSTPVNGVSSQNPIFRKLKTTAASLVLAAAAASMAGKFHPLPARAETPTTVIKEEQVQDQQQQEEEEEFQDQSSDSSTPLSQFIDSNSEAIEALKSLLQQKLEAGEDEEALKVLKKLVSAQPEQTEWKFLMARVLNEMGCAQEAREVFEEILKLNPLSFEALFENALLMDRCGEGIAVITRLEEALKIAENEEKTKEARDVRLIMAQIQFLQKNVDEALRSYEELEREDPSDFRTYFCKGMIYSLLDRNKEAREEFAKYRELSPKKFEVEGYLRTPLSRMKLFGTNEEN
ncbi:hypothetical protein CsSME_00042749 [Camellia sinensis var. sinensis]